MANSRYIGAGSYHGQGNAGVSTSGINRGSSYTNYYGDGVPDNRASRPAPVATTQYQSDYVAQPAATATT